MKHLPSHVWRFSGEEGKTVVIMGSLHGDERMGAKIIDALKNELKNEKISGEVFLILGNPRAFKENKRYIDVDLNRLFNEEYEKISLTPEKKRNIEQKRAFEIAPILKEADILLDIHSTTKKSIPFVYAENSKKHKEFAKTLGTKYMVSPSKSLTLGDLRACADNFVDMRGGIGLTFETGWQHDDGAFDDVLCRTKYVLSQAKIAFVDLRIPKSQPYKHLLIYDYVIPKSNEFSFTEDWKNFDQVDKGGTLAKDATKTLKASRKSYIIFPKKKPEVGSPACYLAT